ncbi:hypothetical protein PHPALM_30481 [Phytophthora palmivora]|uniref:Uncharacterized protein n=1 Tax=Phytophthora palmivora TaxID=4796 RepID=A0A2P4X553_9STRA|nr:hypothetical protein PHPALM_30481 [Phytophthora palmivora]
MSHANLRQEYLIGDEFPPPQVYLRDGVPVGEENLVHQHRVSLPEDDTSRSAETLRSSMQTSIQMQLSSTTQENLYQKVVRPIVKSTIGQRDISCNTLDDLVLNGDAFSAILHKFLDQYSPRVKCKAVKTDEVRSTEQPTVDDWTKVLQFKTRGETATLLIYDYGVVITRTQDLDAFRAACIIPEQTDRAGATAEVSLRDIVASLQENCVADVGQLFTGNLNRSTWEALVKRPPPEYITNLLRPSDSSLQERLSNLEGSAKVALDVVWGSMADYQQLRCDWEAFGRRLEEHERNVETHRRIIPGFVQDFAPPSQVPFLTHLNADDIDHAD